MKTLKIEYMKLSEVIPYDKNPRKNDGAVDSVIKSIKEYGFNNPILVDHENVILAGHTRHKAAVKMGLDEVPVVKIGNLKKEQLIAFRIMDNKSGELAEWDLDLLKEEMNNLMDLDFDLDLTGFDKKELKDIFPINKDNEDDVPDMDKPPKYEIKEGEVWRLGDHRVMCGNCISPQDLVKLMDGIKAKALITDPPYGVSYSDKNEFLNKIDKGCRVQTPIINDDIKDYPKFTSNWLSSLDGHIINTFHIFISGKEIHTLINGIKENGYKYCQDIVWVKNNHVLGRLDYKPKHENILYGWFDRHKFHGGFKTSVLQFDKPLKSDLHPTMKPIALLSELIKDVTEVDNIVLDIFGGSGSTLIACEQTDRKCYMMELDPKYCSVIIERWENLTGKKGVKLNE